MASAVVSRTLREKWCIDCLFSALGDDICYQSCQPRTELGKILSMHRRPRRESVGSVGSMTALQMLVNPGSGPQRPANSILDRHRWNVCGRLTSRGGIERDEHRTAIHRWSSTGPHQDHFVDAEGETTSSTPKGTSTSSGSFSRPRTRGGTSSSSTAFTTISPRSSSATVSKAASSAT